MDDTSLVNALREWTAEEPSSTIGNPQSAIYKFP
jgi:hypothetical protein